MQALLSGPKSNGELAAILGHKGISGAAKIAIKLLLEQGLLAYTIPDKPKSRLQKYMLTDKGREALTAAR